MRDNNRYIYASIKHGKNKTMTAPTSARREKEKRSRYPAILQINFNRSIKRSSRYTHKRQGHFLSLQAHTNGRGAWKRRNYQLKVGLSYFVKNVLM